MNVLENNGVNTQIMGCIVKQTANVFAIEEKALRNQQCADSAIVACVSIMVNMQISDNEIAAFFGEPWKWVSSIKERCAHYKNDPRHNLAFENSQMSILTLSALNGSNTELASGKTEVQIPSQNEQAEGLCLTILKKAEAYFETNRADIIAAATPETKEMKYKITKAMKDAGVKLKEIRAVLGFKNDAAVYYVLDRVDPEDGDLEMIRIVSEGDPGEKRRARAKNEDGPADIQRGDTVAEIDAVIATVEKMKGLEAETVVSGSSHKDARARLVCWKAAILLGISIGALAVRFNRPKPSIQTSLRRITKEEEEEAQTVSRVVQTKSLKSAIASCDGGVETPTKHESVRAENTAKSPRVSTRKLEALEEKVCAVFCSKRLLFSPDPAAEINAAKDALVYLAATGMNPSEVSSSLGISDEEMYMIVGKIAVKIAHDPLFAQKIKKVQKNL